jgi:hypothetical protein
LKTEECVYFISKEKEKLLKAMHVINPVDESPVLTMLIPSGFFLHDMLAVLFLSVVIVITINCYEQTSNNFK